MVQEDLTSSANGVSEGDAEALFMTLKQLLDHGAEKKAGVILQRLDAFELERSAEEAARCEELKQKTAQFRAAGSRSDADATEAELAGLRKRINDRSQLEEAATRTIREQATSEALQDVATRASAAGAWVAAGQALRKRSAALSAQGMADAASSSRSSTAPSISASSFTGGIAGGLAGGLAGAVLSADRKGSFTGSFTAALSSPTNRKSATFSALSPTKTRAVVTVPQLFDGKLGVTLRDGRLLVGFNRSEAQSFGWQLNDEIVEVNYKTVNDRDTFAQEFKLARSRLPIHFTVLRTELSQSSTVEADDENTAASIEKAAVEKAAADKAAAEKAALEKEAAEKAAAEKAAAEEAAAAKAAAERAAAEKAATEKAAIDKARAEKATAEKAAAEKQAAEEKAAVQKAAAEKEVADKEVADKAVAEEAEAEKEVSEQAAAEKVVVERATVKQQTFVEEAASEKPAVETAEAEKPASADEAAVAKTAAEKEALEKETAEEVALDNAAPEKAAAETAADEKTAAGNETVAKQEEADKEQEAPRSNQRLCVEVRSAARVTSAKLTSAQRQADELLRKRMLEQQRLDKSGMSANFSFKSNWRLITVLVVAISAHLLADAQSRQRNAIKDFAYWAHEVFPGDAELAAIHPPPPPKPPTLRQQVYGWITGKGRRIRCADGSYSSPCPPTAKAAASSAKAKSSDAVSSTTATTTTPAPPAAGKASRWLPWGQRQKDGGSSSKGGPASASSGSPSPEISGSASPGTSSGSKTSSIIPDGRPSPSTGQEKPGADSRWWRWGTSRSTPSNKDGAKSDSKATSPSAADTSAPGGASTSGDSASEVEGPSGVTKPGGSQNREAETASQRRSSWWGRRREPVGSATSTTTSVPSGTATSTTTSAGSSPRVWRLPSALRDLGIFIAVVVIAVGLGFSGATAKKPPPKVTWDDDDEDLKRAPRTLRGSSPLLFEGSLPKKRSSFKGLAAARTAAAAASAPAAESTAAPAPAADD